MNCSSTVHCPRGTVLKRRVDLDPVCPLCNNELEDTRYVFAQCQVAKKVWDVAFLHNWLSITLSTLRCIDALQLLSLLYNAVSKCDMDRAN